MKRILLILTLLTNNSYAQVDKYEWCQAQVSLIKKYSTLPIKDLIEIKGSIASATTVEKFSLATGSEHYPMISVIQRHQKISEDEARKAVISLLKPIWMNYMNEAIAMIGVIDELKWNQQFDKCVYNNRSAL